MLEKILAALEALTAAVVANTAAMGTAPADAVKGKTRAQKAIETANAGGATPPPAPAPSPTPPAPAPAPAVTPGVPLTMEKAIELTKELAKVSREKAVAALARHGAGKATELKMENVPAYIADVLAQLAPQPAAAPAGDGLI